MRTKAGKPIRKRSHTLLLTAAMIAMTVYLSWRFLFTLPIQHGAMALILGALLLLAETMDAVEAFVEYLQINRDVHPELPVIDESWYPDVDILIATHNEPADLLYKTVNACTFLEYPDREKVHVYLCDDTNRPEMAQLARELGVGYFGLTGNKLAKAGNLNNALRQTDSPLVVTFDSDMIPRSFFLMRTVPYFFLPMMKRENGKWVPRKADEIDPNDRIGFIQTPQSFYNPDLFQYNLFSESRVPNEQDYFFRDVNVGRNAANAPIYAGSNTMIARGALEAVGYIAHDSITEDFSTGMRIQKAGYRCYAVPESLANGLSPDTVKNLFNQRERWGRGCVQSCRNEHIWASPDLTLSQKISYGATKMYWWTFARRAIYIMAPILSVLFNLPILNAPLWEVVAFWLPSYVLYSQALRVLSGNLRTQHLSNVIDTILFPFLILPIVAESLFIKKKKFVVTGKKKEASSTRTPLLFGMPHLILMVAGIWALTICVGASLRYGTLYNAIILYWLVINTKNLLFALFFMYGRTNHRMAERFYAANAARIKTPGRVLDTVTTDVSETGFAVAMDRPEYIPQDQPVEVEIRYGSYRAVMRANIVHAFAVGAGWKYSFHIVGMDAQNRRQYMQIVYDREHSHPKELAKNVSIFDDFNLNVTKRFERFTHSLRKLPRIHLNLPFSGADGESGIIDDFNYQYASIKTTAQVGADDILAVRFDPGISLYFAPIGDQVGHGDVGLYEVLNMKDLIYNDAFDAILDEWIRTGERGERASAGQAAVIHADALKPYRGA